MARFVTISGPSATGKTTLFNELSKREEMKNVAFVPDIFYTVWQDLVDRGLFSEYDDISRDTEFLCVFIQRVINHYKETIDYYSAGDDDLLVIIDSCWVDISVYSILNMWYTHIVKEVQEGLLYQLSNYDDNISRIYVTQFDESKMSKEKYRIPFKRYNIKYNRPLELQYYRLATHFKDAMYLPSTEVDDNASFIIEDLKDLGYI